MGHSNLRVLYHTQVYVHITWTGYLFVRMCSFVIYLYLDLWRPEDKCVSNKTVPVGLFFNPHWTLTHPARWDIKGSYDTWIGIGMYSIQDILHLSDTACIYIGWINKNTCHRTHWIHTKCAWNILNLHIHLALQPCSWYVDCSLYACTQPASIPVQNFPLRWIEITRWRHTGVTRHTTMTHTEGAANCYCGRLSDMNVMCCIWELETLCTILVDQYQFNKQPIACFCFFTLLVLTIQLHA